MTMEAVMFRRVSYWEKPIFQKHFQEYLGELARLNGVRPNRKGQYEYGLLDLYWMDERFKPFFMEWARERAGLMLLRELDEQEGMDGRPSIQLAEIFVFKTFRMRGVGRDAMRFAAKIAAEYQRPLTWSAYINNDPANALYASILEEFAALENPWKIERSRGVDISGLARYYYRMTPGAEPRKPEQGPGQ